MKVICWLFFISSFVFAKPLITITRRVDLSRLKVNSKLHLKDDGRFSFTSNTGSWSSCGSDTAGKFSGKLSKNELEKIKQQFLMMDKFCSQNSSCTNSATKIKGANRWEVLGWGEFGSKNYYFEDSENTPALIWTVLRKEKLFKNKMASALKIELNNKSKNKAKLTFSYHGKGFYPVVVAEGVFEVIGKDGRKEFKKKNGKLKKLTKNIKTGEFLSIELDYADYQLESGDELIYRATAKDLNPCIVLK